MGSGVLTGWGSGLQGDAHAVVVGERAGEGVAAAQHLAVGVQHALGGGNALEALQHDVVDDAVLAGLGVQAVVGAVGERVRLLGRGLAEPDQADRERDTCRGCVEILDADFGGKMNSSIRVSLVIFGAR